MAEKKVNTARQQMVVQGNDFIRHARNQMSAQELDMIYFWISKIKPTDTDFMRLTFTVAEFCEICGIDGKNGKNYRDVKAVVKSIADKSAWVETKKGVEELIRWVDTSKIEHDSGTMTVVLSQSLKPFLIQLIERGNYTQAEIINFLALRSRYSKRLYEILKSYQRKGYAFIMQEFDMDELKKLLAAEKYIRYPDFKRKVLDIALREINEFTDSYITFEVIKTGRKYTGVKFGIQRKQPLERFNSYVLAEKRLDE
jgi:plasmid replication initiation protein